MDLSAKIAEIAINLGLNLTPYPGPYQIHRTYAGRHQRSAGAWSWFLVDQNGMEVVGSCFTATEIVREHRKGNVKGYRPDWGGVFELDVDRR